MAPPASRPGRSEVIDAYKYYDRSVDIASVFHWLYTDISEMRETVSHFERYPNLRHNDGDRATPDFLVRFKDGTGLLGEIAKISLRDESVEKLCRQLQRYAELTEQPALTCALGSTPMGGSRRAVPIRVMDVLLIVPFEVGPDAVQRIIHERFLDSAHCYKPPRAPCIVQYAFTDGNYVFQRLPHKENGELDANRRNPTLGEWLLRAPFKPRVNDWSRNKTAYAFCNDPIDPLYLAVQLWQHVIPTMIKVAPGSPYTSLDTTVEQVRDKLRELYARGRMSEVRKALELLANAGLASSTDGARYRIAWGELRLRPGEADVAEALAARSLDPNYRGGLIQRRLRDDKSRSHAPPTQMSLFEYAGTDTVDVSLDIDSDEQQTPGVGPK